MADQPDIWRRIYDVLSGPPEQRVHVLGGLLDHVRDQRNEAPGLRDDVELVLRRQDPWIVFVDCALTRFHDEERRGAHEELLLEEVLDAGFPPVELIACLILLAPLVSYALVDAIEQRPAFSVEVATAVLASVPDAPRQRLTAMLLDRAEQSPDPGDRARLLVALAPLLSGASRERVRTLGNLLPDPQQRAVAEALASSAPPASFRDSLSPHVLALAGSSLAWWPTTETRELLADLPAGFQAIPIAERLARLPLALRDAVTLSARSHRSVTISHSSRSFWDVDDPEPTIREDLTLGSSWTGFLEEPEPANFFPAVPTRSLDIEDDARSIRPQHISLGFARRSTPTEPLSPERTLAAQGRYYVWVEIGPELTAGSLLGAVPLPEIQADSELHVVLFDFPDQIRIDPQHRRGTLRVRASGPAEVVGPAAILAGIGELVERRLFFPVRMPLRPGHYALRCNIYYRQLLLQSHLITVNVTLRAVGQPGALKRVTDYTLSATLDTGRLAGIEPHRLSILLNDDGAGTHGFRFVGEHGFIADAHVDGATLAALVDYARGALRRVAWGTAEPWRSHERDRYRYATPPPPGQCAADLVLLARHGYRLWGQTLAFFGVRGDMREELRWLMRETGVVQLALKKSADHVFPAALIYDYPLDTNLEHLTLCQTAAAAMDAGADLEAVPCFAGDCPDYYDRAVVCPSGFWGFRHDLGVPLHLGERGEVAAEIARAISTRALIGVSTDPAFTARTAHVAALGRLDPRVEIKLVEDRRDCLAALESAPPHLAYFFCHGGITSSGTPYLEVGDRHSEPITADNLLEIWWEEPRPLVVLNGCHTTAASPEQIFSLVTGFVVHANAAGVIGTEITIFEPMAVAFGEELLRRFLGGDPIGRAVRRARLALLRKGNPLGLAYIPFALATLRLTA